MFNFKGVKCNQFLTTLFVVGNLIFLQNFVNEKDTTRNRTRNTTFFDINTRF